MKKIKPLALYVHIPFCVRKCLYCDFLSAPASSDIKKAYIRKLTEELAYRRDEISGEYQIETVFIGGGTPTCLSENELSCLGESILNFPLSKHLEYTMEANPGTISDSLALLAKEMQVNRISIGLQSANDEELKALGRIYTYRDFEKSFDIIRKTGFQNVNIDLMADIPGQTIESYKNTLESVCAFEPEHISSYSLIVEEGTPFYELQEKGMLQIPDEDTDRQMYEMTGCILNDYGYIRYEISNYAKEGKECRHNLTYWEMGEYLGVGLGASSFYQGARFRNETELKSYLTNPAADSIEKEKNILTKKEEIEEFVFLGLRKCSGISILEFKKRFHLDFYEVYQNVVQALFQKELLAESRNRDRIYLTEKGIDVSNMVLAEFLL